MLIRHIAQLLAVGLLWGVTNPFMRLGSQGIESVKDTGSKWRNLLQEARLIGTRWRYWVPFGLNQCGSALYVWTLQNSSITVAVPVANSLSFAFTAITGFILGEKLPGKSKFCQIEGQVIIFIRFSPLQKSLLALC